jgi:DNA-binding Lrp family transcriptional regulator
MSDSTPWLTYRQEWVELLDGDSDGALVLEQMLQWQQLVRESDREWVSKSSRQLADDIPGLTKSKCHRRLKQMEESGILESRTFDDPQRAKGWKVDYDRLREMMEESGIDPSGFMEQPGSEALEPLSHSGTHPVPERDAPLSQSETHPVPERDTTKYTNNKEYNSKEESQCAHEESESETTEDTPLIEPSGDQPDISEYFDDLDNRNPLDESDQVTLPEFSQGWKAATGNDWGQQGGSGWHMAAGPDDRDLAKFRVISTYFTKGEIKSALREVKKSDPSHAWSYFRAVLEEQCQDTDKSESVIDRYKDDGRKLTSDDDTPVAEKYAMGGQT